MTVSWKKPKLTKEETEGFEAYTVATYKADLDLARRIVNDWIGGISNQGLSATGLLGWVFDKLATPRVFLIDKWRDLDPDERRKYWPKEEQERQATEAKRISEEAGGMLS